MIKWFESPLPHLENTVLTMGNFDGLHQGHRKLLTEVLLQSRLNNITPVILTYLEHPGHFIHFSHPVKILTPRNLKLQQIRQLGFEHVFFLNFSSETAHISAGEFLSEVIVKNFTPSVIVSGYDTHFGYQREGNSDYLVANESTYGYKTIQIDPVYCDEIKPCKEDLDTIPGIISSSAIRRYIQAGRVDIASYMLGRPYRLYGTVTHGRKIGTVIGFPTINLNLLDPEQLIPADGIYLTKMMIQNSQYFGLTNIGTSPTLKNSGQIEIETHILDFASDLYDQDIELDFISYLRKEKQFNGSEELIRAIRSDIAQGREIINKL